MTVFAGEIVAQREPPRLAWPGEASHTLLGAGMVAILVAVLLGVNELHVAAAGPRAAIETTITLSAVVSGVLLWIQFGRTRRLRDLLLLAALATVSLTDLAFDALPAIGNYQLGVHGIGARLAGMMLATGVFTAAAFTSHSEQVDAGGRRLAWFAVGASLCGIAGAELLGLIVGRSGAGAAELYRPAADTVAAVSCGGLLLAGWNFTGKRWGREESGALLGLATLLLAGAALQWLSRPLLRSDWVTPADLMRLAAYALLLTAALRLHAGTRRQMEADTLSAQRAKIAHDLHDGLAQDLALIAAHGERLEQAFGVEHPLVVAAGRALAVSRGHIVDLVASDAVTTDAALGELAAELEMRYGIEITVFVEDAQDPHPNPRQRQELLRIVREAIANAVHHGKARHIAVTLGSRRDHLVVRIVDDGCGIGSPAAKARPGTGLGMAAMGSRARALGGALTVGRTEAGGTQIDVMAGHGSDWRAEATAAQPRRGGLDSGGWRAELGSGVRLLPSRGRATIRAMIGELGHAEGTPGRFPHRRPITDQEMSMGRVKLDSAEREARD